MVAARSTRRKTAGLDRCAGSPVNGAAKPCRAAIAVNSTQLQSAPARDQKDTTRLGRRVACDLNRGRSRDRVRKVCGPRGRPGETVGAAGEAVTRMRRPHPQVGSGGGVRLASSRSAGGGDRETKEEKAEGVPERKLASVSRRKYLRGKQMKKTAGAAVSRPVPRRVCKNIYSPCKTCWQISRQVASRHTAAFPAVAGPTDPATRAARCLRTRRRPRDRRPRRSAFAEARSSPVCFFVGILCTMIRALCSGW